MGNKVKVTVKTVSDNFDKLQKVLDDLNSYAVEIGVFASDDSFYAMLANVHEFGITIKPKKAKRLTIPISPKSHGKRARDFPDLFRPYGTDVLAIPNGKDSFEVLFVLLEEVTIPERAFMRTTFDEKEKKWYQFLEKEMKQVLAFKRDVKTMLERLGAMAVGDIQEKMTNMSPGNAGATTSAKRSNTSLVDTGGLRQRITWKVVKR